MIHETRAASPPSPCAGLPYQGGTIRGMGPLTLGMALVLFLLALVPTRRLHAAGVRPGWLAGYLALLIGLGLLSIELEALVRYLVPVELLVFLLPFTGIVERSRRLRAIRGRGRRAAADVVVEGTAVRLDPRADQPRETGSTASGSSAAGSPGSGNSASGTDRPS